MTPTLRARRLLPVLLLALGLLALLGSIAGAQGGSPVRVLTATGVVDQVMASYLTDGITRADGQPRAHAAIRPGACPRASACATARDGPGARDCIGSA